MSKSKIWLVLFLIALLGFFLAYSISNFKTTFQIETNTREINETARQQKLNEQFLDSMNYTLHQFQKEERAYNQKIYDKIVTNQRIIIGLGNNSIKNQKYIVDHFDNVTNDLKRIINLAGNNTKLTLDLTDLNRESIVNNLNLTKFNRAALLDSNIMIHKLWENLTGINPCYDNAFANCINPKVKNVSQLVTNYSASARDIYDPKQSGID